MLNYSAISIFWWNCPLSIPFLQNLLLEDKSEWLFLFATTAVPILVWQCIGLVQDIFLAAPPIKNAVYKNISCDYSTYSDEREGERWWGWGSNKLVRGEAHWERDGIFLGSFTFLYFIEQINFSPVFFNPSLCCISHAKMYWFVPIGNPTFSDFLSNPHQCHASHSGLNNTIQHLFTFYNSFMMGWKKPACNKRGPLGGGISGTFSENISPRDYNTLPLMFISLQNLSLTSTPSNMK